jgi:carbamate kinase
MNLSFQNFLLKKQKHYIETSEFGKGSMEPKIVAAVQFVESNKNGQAIIASLEEAALAVKGKAGTIIYQS